MKISILIPTYNRRNLLERALQSVVFQKGDFEIIVVDDASNDGTQEFMERFTIKHKNIIYIRQPKNCGVNVARNLGICKSNAEWIACLDDDDEFLPESLEKMEVKLATMPENFNVAYFNTFIKTNDEEFKGGFQFKNLIEQKDFYDPTYKETMFKFNLRGDCKPVFKKSLFRDKKYLFPETVNGFESYTMNLIARDKKGIRYFPELITLIHQETAVGDRLSLSASIKKPWPLLVLHFKQIFQHSNFYLKNQAIFWHKKIMMFKLLIHVFLNFLKRFYRVARRIFGLQRWIRLGLRYRISLPETYENVDFTVSFFGYKYSGNLNDYIDKYVFYFGAYEREELLYLKKFINKNSIVLDIGANTGHHSLFFSKFAKQVYSFEPYGKLFYKLIHRMEQNGVQNVKAYDFGLGKENRESDFFASVGSNEGVGSFIPSSDKTVIGKLVIKNGDEFVMGVGEKIDLIKIDVEGMETEVLNGLKQTIIRDRPVMFVEMTPKAQVEIGEDIKKNYDVYIVDANNPILYFFNKPGCKLKKLKLTNRIENLLFVPKIDSNLNFV